VEDVLSIWFHFGLVIPVGREASTAGEVGFEGEDFFVFIDFPRDFRHLLFYK